MRFFSTAPLVVIGMHRSGTTMLTEALERGGVLMGRDHTAYAESNFFQRCNVELLRAAHANWDKPVVTNTKPDGFNLRNWLSEYAGLMKQPLGWWPLLFKRGWGWKDPRNTYTLGSWLSVFPNLRAIHIVRNGLDVARSLYERNAMLQPGSKWHSSLLNDPVKCFELWERYVLQAAEWKKQLGDRYVSIRYEDTVALNKDALQRLEDFSGRKLRNAFASVVDKERGAAREPLDGMEALKQHARSNQTLFRLGYAVE